MDWKNKIDQLIALLEKIPQPQSFDLEKGIYQPYFILELRTANWEILPYAEYTRLDGEPGKEVKLSYQVVESRKVNITQDELQVLSYIYSITNYETRRLFSYGQPIGFLLDWLRTSRLHIRYPEQRETCQAFFEEETGNLCLGIFKREELYILQPAIVFQEKTLILDDHVDVLSSNPIYLHYKNVLYHVESDLAVFFWINFFRLQHQIEIPVDELKEFINDFMPKILPALDWQSLEEHLKLYELPLKSPGIYLAERAGQLTVDVKFRYQNVEFQAQPVSEKSLATRGKYLFVVKRDQQKETEIRRLLQKHGLFYIQHHWQIDPQYKVMDWLRTQVPELAKKGMEIYGEETLFRHRLRRGTPRLRMRVSSGTDWLDLQFRFQINGQTVEVPDLRAQVQENKRYVKLTDGSQIYLSEKLTERLTRFFSLLDVSQSEGQQKFPPSAFPLVETLTHLADEVEVDEQFKEWKQNYDNFNKLQAVEIPERFCGVLRDYQKAGLDWLYFLHRFRFGGILADDMGLGKTVQVIALLQKLEELGELQKPALIVVPLTVLFNWENEFSRFAPHLKLLCYQGQKQDREQMVLRFPDVHVVLMSYGIFLQDELILREQNWGYLILDESQKIKNPSTKTYQTAVSFRVPQRLCLTGTPVENSLTDLWSQFNFLNPGMLGSLQQFEDRFIRNGDGETDRQDLLRRMMYPFILRRKKEQVLKELPERTEIIRRVEMTAHQRDIYKKWLDYYRGQIFERIEQEGLPKTRFKILEALTYLRQIACHPSILERSVPRSESGKLQLLEEMLGSIIQVGHKVLVYSQFVRFLKLIREMLDKKSWRYEYLDGSTRNRQAHVRNFQENEQVKTFLISLKAGGLGLNLTAADYVIHLDPWWNPAVEQQATDRVHRIGQENRVFVYKFIVKSSVEEKILTLQQQKKEISDSLITSEKTLVKQLSPEDLELIFKPVE